MSEEIEIKPWMLETRVNEFGRPEACWGAGKHDWLVLIPSGEYWMGAVPLDNKADDDEYPRHKVIITKPYWMMKYPVTVEQYETVTGKKCGIEKTDITDPCSGVSWNDAQYFIEVFNKTHEMKFRLPTEAEWEYAAWGRYSNKAKDEDEMEGYESWLISFRCNFTHSVGQRDPNGFGLFDVVGNAQEWVQDWYYENYYEISPEIDPKGPDIGWHRVLRGRVIITHHDNRLTNRLCIEPDKWNGLVGFRCAQDY